MAIAATSKPRRPTGPRRLRARSVSDRGGPGWLGGYLDYTETPLASLWFILPMLLLHDLGVRHLAPIAGRLVEYRVTAFCLMGRFFEWFGAYGHLLPACAVVAVLLAWHWARNDPWVFNSLALVGMVVESVAWAIPLAGVYFLAGVQVSLGPPPPEWKLLSCLYLGAGIYEEMVFRLACFAALSFLLIDMGHFRPTIGIPLVVVIAAIAFSAYHLLGSEHLPWQGFVFVTLRGVYYGTIFLYRGFGLCVGVHASYDLIAGLLLCEKRGW